MDATLRTGLMAAGLAFGMTGLGYASAPLYRLFCQTTGFAGTTQRATGDAPGAVAGGPAIRIRFDANHAPELPWTFEPERSVHDIALGARDIAFYDAKNLASYPVTGRAVFNVSPSYAGKYFKKIQCFCFSLQTLTPGKQVRMPVTYFVDPAIALDPNTRDIDEITLSYTFYPVDEGKKPS
jgi:cytochrome c oxidase assembly protein subunit 11